MLWKEQGVTVLAVLAVYDLFVFHRLTFRQALLLPFRKVKPGKGGRGGDPVAPPLFQLTASFLKLARAETAGVTLSNYDPFNENQSGVINLHLSRDGSQGREHVSRTCFLKCSQKMQSNEREANPQEGR